MPESNTIDSGIKQINCILFIIIIIIIIMTSFVPISSKIKLSGTEVFIDHRCIFTTISLNSDNMPRHVTDTDQRLSK